jgi:hypothetical protein
MTEFRIESLLSARLFLSPQIVGDRIYLSVIFREGSVSMR